MERLTNKQIQHLYWRAGFGISYQELETVNTFSKDQIVDQLFKNHTAITPLQMDFGALLKNPRELSKEERRKLRQLRNTKMTELNLLWLNQLITTESILREKMTLFFHDHFAVRLRTPRACIHLNNVIRKNALENFGDMLMEVSKSPAMLIFLNNRQNRKDHPNENFAREVMELFTLGRDNGYTENDIKEAARAFTGWNFTKMGSFVFRSAHHDYGSKTILGKTGNFTGEDVIQILLEEKQTARYICQKLYQYFVNDTIVDVHVEKLTEVLYNSNYDLSAVMKSLLKSDWFYKPVNIGSKIKSPIELIVGLNRPFKVTFENPKVLLYLQKKLNQMLFFPPNVAGWPGGKAWIDNSTLMLRLKLPSLTLNSGVIEWDETPSENTMMKQQLYQKMKTKLQKKVKATPNWNSFLTIAKQKNKTELIDFLIQPELSPVAHTSILDLSEDHLKNYVTAVLSLPEYQLC